MKSPRLLLPVVLLMVSACSQAESPAASTKAAVPAKVDETIRAKLKKAISDVDITSVRPTPMPGLYEVRAKGYGTAYVSADGHYMLQGELIEIQGDKLVNVTDQGMAADRKAALATVAKKDMIIFPAVGKTKGVAYVFTDIDCGYCRKLHGEVPAMNQLGIEIRYLAFPRAGYPSPIAQRMEAVWCNENPGQALTQAKQGGQINSPVCPAPVRAQYELGLEMGVRGTPAVFLENGMQVGGYLSPKDMAAALNIK